MHLLTVILSALFYTAHGQLTASTSVAPSLRECYTNVTMLNRNNLPPTTIQALIDIIQKIEDNPSVNLDMRQLATLLLHTYRQDGIEYHQPETLNNAANVLPYAPTFHSFFRHKLLLTKIIPASLQELDDDVLPSDLKCALHFMLSITVDGRLRGDESVCNQLSRYRALRTGRSVDDDVELFDPTLLNNVEKIGHMRQFNPKDDVEFNSGSERQMVGDSLCPLLGGAVNTPWGAAAAGSVIAGIAAGSQTQQVPISELAKGSVISYANAPQSVTAIYPATLSGDLAEAVLIQGTERGSSTISVGLSGGWNSTQAKKFYMLTSRINTEMTDPEIRGDLDGLILGLNSNSFNSYKLSQVLDMYYSPRNGVLNPDLRACKRRTLSQTYVVDTNLATETFAFAAALDTNMPLRGTITGGLEQLVNNAVSNLQSYINNLNDMTCDNSETVFSDVRYTTNLYLVIDSSWQYEAIYPAISYLLDIIEVNKFGSSVTLLSAVDGSIIVNKTFSITDFHTQYTYDRHRTLLSGVNLQTTFTNIRIMMQDSLENERLTNYVGGNSTVLLFLLNSGNIQNNEHVLQEARTLNETVPDLVILFATATNHFNELWNLVRNMHTDIMTVSLTSGFYNENAMSQVGSRVQQVGRRIINPTCGYNYTTEILSGTKQFNDFVEPGYINFYSISPNYFYVSNDNIKLRVSRSSSSGGNLIVCYSRVVSQPRQNGNNTAGGTAVNEGVTCQTLATGNVEISLKDACDGYSTINSCPLFYISVQSPTALQSTGSSLCIEHACRFPYNIKYTITIDDFSCISGASAVTASLLIIAAAFATLWFQ